MQAVKSFDSLIRLRKGDRWQSSMNEIRESTGRTLVTLRSALDVYVSNVIQCSPSNFGFFKPQGSGMELHPN